MNSHTATAEEAKDGGLLPGSDYRGENLQTLLVQLVELVSQVEKGRVHILHLFLHMKVGHGYDNHHNNNA